MSTSSDPSQASESRPVTGAIDEEAVLRAKQEIQGLVQEVVELSRAEVEPNEFYAALIDKAVSALAAIGGVVWTVEEGAGFKLEYQVNLRETGLAENEAAQLQHGRLLQQVIERGEPALVQPHSGAGDDVEDQAAANQTDFLLVIAPIKSDRGVDGVVEIFQRAGARPTTQRGYQRFLAQICELAGEYVKNRRLRHLTTKQSLWEQLEAFTGLVHQALNSSETAYTIANEGRRLIGCDRVTVVLRRGMKYRVAAISGQETFDKRSNVVRLLRKLATTVARTGDDLWFDGDTANLAPQVEKAVNAYVDESHTKHLAVLPLREAVSEEEKPGERKRQQRENILGAIILEQLVDSRQPEGMLQRVDVVRRHSATSLTNAQAHENLFLLPLWRFLGKTRVLVTARNLPKTLLALVALGGAISAMCYMPYDFNVIADGKLLPEVRRDVFASAEGKVIEIAVERGTRVKAGEVVVRQQSLDQEDRETALEGKFQETLKEIESTRWQRKQVVAGTQEEELDRDRLAGQLSQLKVRLESLKKQRKLLDRKKEQLVVTSPIDGIVTTWKVRDLLEGRTVRQGQRLMEIADPASRWELAIDVPEAKMGHIVAQLTALREEDPASKLQVNFFLATHSDVRLSGRVEEIDRNAEVRGENGNTVRMRVSFRQEDLKKLVNDPSVELKIGADVKAKVFCGRRPIGYVWFSDLFEFVQSRILFRF
ncbi:MAG: HlyD family efflux transporter periplasmic adaptor subunit [Pirellulales bacterium]|nr:HlyD family efflux transporter periplasmic adaptor subunit [Pirellulales bacterium]